MAFPHKEKDRNKSLSYKERKTYLIFLTRKEQTFVYDLCCINSLIEFSKFIFSIFDKYPFMN